MPSERIKITWQGKEWVKERHYCEGCMKPDAPFGIQKSDRRHWFCAMDQDRNPYCKVKGINDD